jgi:hypothetical protein
MSAQKRQSTDAANSGSIGTVPLSQRQPDFLKPNKLQDGNAGQKGKAVPADKTGTR